MFEPSIKKLSSLIFACILVLLTGCSSSSTTSGDESQTDAGTDGEVAPNSTDSSVETDDNTAEPDSEEGNAVERIDQATIVAAIFSPNVTDFSVNVFYEEGAEPYTGTLSLTNRKDTWEVTRDSYTDLFQHHTGRIVSIPSELAQMRQIPDNGVMNWTAEALVALGNSIAPSLSSGSSVRTSIIFVNGLFRTRDSVLGVQISNTHFAFVFKDVIRSVGGNDTSQKYLEQATVVHEIGHAIGLVNNGLPMASEHEDVDHSGHTANSDGIMYWAVESANGALDFLADVIVGGNTSLFGPESLLDAQSFMPQ